MRVLLLNQPFIKDFCRCQRWPARTRGRALRMPDWLCYAAAVLKADGVDAELYDFIANNWNKDKLAEVVRSRKPDCVVLDATTPSIYSDIECARICKDAGCGLVVMVGTHVSALPEETLELSRGSVDVIALGEYDYTICDVVRSWPVLDNVAGICFLRGNKPVFTATRPLIGDLDSLPFPVRAGLDINAYFDAGRLFPYINIIGGRGCPYRCTFCQWPQLMFGHAYRLRSAKNIIDEIEFDLKLFPGLKHGEFYFEDDTFTVNKERALAICDEIRRRKLRITWSINARPDLIDEGLFRQMKQLGCRQFLVGFESGDQSILDAIKKGISLDTSRQFVRIVQKAGISVHGCFVLGLPGETPDTARRTVDFALNLGLDTLQFSAAVPLPGTEYFDYCRSQGLLRAKAWDDWLDGGEQGAVVEYPGLSIGQINQLVDSGLKRFYMQTGFISRFLFRNRDVFDVYRKLRGGANFLSYLLRRR